MFRRVPLSIVGSLFTVHSAMVYVIQLCRQLSSRSICSCSTAVYKPVWHIPLLSVQWINFRWWTEELSETCRVSCQNKFVKLVHLVGFIIKKRKIRICGLHTFYFFGGGGEGSDNAVYRTKRDAVTVTRWRDDTVAKWAGYTGCSTRFLNEQEYCNQCCCEAANVLIELCHTNA